jgi:hypothetical protein
VSDAFSQLGALGSRLAGMQVYTVYISMAWRHGMADTVAGAGLQSHESMKSPLPCPMSNVQCRAAGAGRKEEGYR